MKPALPPRERERNDGKWNLAVDVALCNNCANCALAALDEHVGNDFPG